MPYKLAFYEKMTSQPMSPSMKSRLTFFYEVTSALTLSQGLVSWGTFTGTVGKHLGSTGSQVTKLQTFIRFRALDPTTVCVGLWVGV